MSKTKCDLSSANGSERRSNVQQIIAPQIIAANLVSSYMRARGLLVGVS